MKGSVKGLIILSIQFFEGGKPMRRIVSLGIALLGGVLMAAPQSVRADDSDGKIVQIQLRGALAEVPPKMDIGSLLGEEQQPNLFNLLETLCKADG